MTGLTGRTIGHYRIMEKLGHGGMAEVYRAYHANLDRYVAIKFIRTELAENENFQARFEREARTAARLHHHHIVLIHDSGREENLYYLVMEFIDGITLKRHLLNYQQEGTRLPLSQVVALMQQVGSALDYAHDQNVVHRDVKPDNILIRADGRAVLTDFGIARMVDDTNGLTMTGTTMGTPTYMSPEQIKGDKEKIGPGSDIYSLGIILYEMLLGQVPFQADTPFAVMLKHVNDPIPLPAQIDSSISDEVQRVIFKLLSKEPADRYPSAQQMVDELAAAIADMPDETISHEIASPTIPSPAINTLPISSEPPSADYATIDPTVAFSEETVVSNSATYDATEVMPTADSGAVEPAPKRKWLRRLAIGAAALLGLFAILIILNNLQDSNAPHPFRIMFVHDELGIFMVEAAEGAQPQNVSERLTAQTDLEGEDFTLNFSSDGSWAVGSTDRAARCDWGCLAILRGDFSSGGPVLVDGEPVHIYEHSIISNNGERIIFDGEGQPHIRDLLLLERPDNQENDWELVGSITEQSPYEWNSFPQFSPNGDRVIFMCGPEPYGGYDSAICEFDLEDHNFRVLLTAQEHSAYTGIETESIHFPFYTKEGHVLYTDWSTDNTWLLRLRGGDDFEIEQYFWRGAICGLANGWLLIPEWDDENMGLIFADPAEQEEVFRIETGFSGDQVYSFNCSGG